MKRITDFMVTAVLVGYVAGTALLGTALCGCSADIEIDNSKSAAKGSSVEGTKNDEKHAPTAEELLEAKRDREEASYSKTNSAPLYIEKPMAWFQETNDQMIFTRKKLLEAQARISVIYGKYDRQIKAAGDKAKGYLDLLDKAEKTRAEGKAKGWPVAFDQWVIDDEAALDTKIAEINAAMGKNRVLSVEDMAMYNAAKKGLKTSRETLVRFDDAYLAFTRTWDKVKLGIFNGIPLELEKDVNTALDITQVFINEWNRVK
ncbi:MAG: hypothetical protein ACI4Q3_08735 [Kiritimatiellia bacterium]